MKIRYVHPITGVIVKVARDLGYISFKEKYGTRVQTFRIRHREQVHHYLDHRGYKRLRIWRCTCMTCGRVQDDNPCKFQRDSNPSGECLMYPKADHPNLEHHNVKYTLE